MVKIFSKQATCHSPNAQSRVQNLENILENTLFHMGRRCEDGFLSAQILWGKISSAHRKQTFQSGQPGCIPCKTHAGVTPVLKVGVHLRCKDQKNGASRFAFYYAKEYCLGYIYAATPTRKLTPRQRSSGLGAWNAPWLPDCKVWLLRRQDDFTMW